MSAQSITESEDPLPNPRRGCGTLKPGKAYLVGAGFSPDGVLPSWVECRPHIPYREVGTEGEFTRGYQKIDGVSMQTALDGDLAEFVPHYPDELFGEAREDCHYEALENLVDHGVYDFREGILAGDNVEWDDLDDDQRRQFIEEGPVPTAEIDRHLDRVAHRGAEGGRHWGNIPITEQTDLLMRAGASYYPDPEDYATEAIRHGLSKAIPVSPRQEPPAVVSGITRCWIMHPEACDGYGGGIIGYAYLSEVAFTEPAEGDVPEYVEEFEETGKLAVREFDDPPEPEEEDDDNAALADFDGGDDGE